jgi:hypothetical protein
MGHYETGRIELYDELINSLVWRIFQKGFTHETKP